MKMTKSVPISSSDSTNATSHLRTLIITSCTGEKRFKPTNQLTLEDFKDEARLQSRSSELAEFACPASQIYTGLQHLRVIEAVELLRQSFGKEAIDLVILSAGYGLIPENQIIVPYEVTFNTMKGHEVDEWAKFLEVHQAFEKTIADYDLVFLLLGENYLRSLRLPVVTKPEQTLIFLTSKTSAALIKGLVANIFVLPLSNAEAKRYSYGLVGLKGFLLKRFAESVVSNPELLQKLYENPENFTQAIESQSTQLELPLRLPEVQVKKSSNKKTQSDEDMEELEESEGIDFLPIPDLPPAPNIHLGMKYFIPEWDDRVDPNYDFLTDTCPPNRDHYADQVYAHELYPIPNYDGVLVSKVVIDQSKSKRGRVEAVGIHKFVRFPGNIMGDCGAFGYVKEEQPPYNTDEILDYYQRLGFNYGVSIDHLIVGPFAEPGIREKRYELTLKNANEFINKHKERGYSFTPMGVAQGWSPETYAQAVKENIQMGYDYIAIGGLARSPSKQIYKILEAVYPHLTSKTRIHLFGIARINTIPAFRHLGVNSVDSASFLRRAWLGSGANFHTISSKMYTAIRVPPVSDNGVRVKRLIEAGVAEEKTFRKLEQEALKALRDFDKGKLGLEETLEAVLAYDELIELPRDGKVDPKAQAKRSEKHQLMYRELLEDRPWKMCGCPLCEAVGIEIIIFRNNNRNRRRGFHNTYAFYKRFKDLLSQLEKVD